MTTGATRATWARELQRKALHLGTAALPVAWALGRVEATHIRWALGTAVVVAVTIEVVRARSSAVREAFTAMVGRLLRQHEAHGVTGATWLAVAMWIAATLAPAPAAITALWAGAVGDASAALVGRATSSRAALGHKSAGGSLAVLVTTALGAQWLVQATWPTAIALGTVAMLAERPRLPIDDNLRVVLAVAVAATLLGLR